MVVGYRIIKRGELTVIRGAICILTSQLKEPAKSDILLISGGISSAKSGRWPVFKPVRVMQSRVDMGPAIVAAPLQRAEREWLASKPSQCRSSSPLPQL